MSARRERWTRAPTPASRARHRRKAREAPERGHDRPDFGRRRFSLREDDQVVDRDGARPHALGEIRHGPQRERYPRQLAAKLGVADRLHLPGLRDDSPALYPAFDVFCLPSYREGLPLALLEALAAGLPAAVTAVGGVPEVIGDRSPVALTVAPGDVEGLAQGLTRLLDDSDLRARLGAEARRRVEERFSRAQMARAVARLYDGLLEEDRAALE